jgi:DNA-binding NtrC family response regulator
MQESIVATGARLPQPLADYMHPAINRKGEPVPAGRETILVVEDGEAVRKLVCEMLTAHGYNVIEARDAREAKRIWERDPDAIDLVLTDVLMPHISGGELALAMSDIRPETRVLFMSGYPGEDILQEFERIEELFLQKPFTSGTLVEKIRNILDRPWEGLNAFRKTV